MKKTLDVISIGGATWDVFVRTDLSKVLRMRDFSTEKSFLCFDYGAKMNVEGIDFTTGGGATNTCVTFARMGLKTAFLGKVGNDEAADKVLKALTDEGVNTSLAHRSRRFCTGYSVVLSSFEGDRTILTYRGANSMLRKNEVNWKTLKEAQWFYISSLSGNTAQLLDDFVDYAVRNQIRIAFNPGGSQIKQGMKGLKKILQHTDLLLLNAEEASDLTGIKSSRRVTNDELCSRCQTCVNVCPEKMFSLYNDKIVVTHHERCTLCGLCTTHCPEHAILIEPWADNLDQILKALRRHGAGIVAVTDGGKGIQVYDGKVRYIMPPYPVTVVDTLGAGDAFGSAFLTGLIQHDSVPHAIEHGCANAASVVTQYGAKAGILRMNQLDNFIAEHGNEHTKVRTSRL